MITGSIKAYVAGLVAVLLLMLLIPTFIHNATLQHKVKTLEDRNTQLISDSILRKMAVENMRTAVADQELKIKEFENIAQRMAEARLKAQQEAAQRILTLNNRIAWLEQDKGASCTAAGIGKTILDEVLP
jgi:F420-0:gamma-glutamyl ligase